MTKEALTLALEALETNNKAWKHLADSGDAGFWEAEEQGFYELSVKAITAIKEALAQPEQEPVAIVTSETGDPDITMSWWHEPALPVGTPLYTTPPQRKPLTDEEIGAILEGVNAYGTRLYTFAQAIEAAHGIKE